MVYKRLLCRALSLLGFSGMVSGCGASTHEEPCAYGTPYAEYDIKGAVTDTESRRPLEGIRVVIHHPEENPQLIDTLYTDREGKYVISDQHQHVFPTAGIMLIRAEDIDSAEGGGFYGEKDIRIEVANDDFKGGEGWFEGKLEREVNIALERMEPVEEE